MEWSRSNILGYDVHFQIKYIGFFETNPVTLFFSSFLRANSFSVTLCFIFVDVYMFFIYYDYQREVMSTDFLRNWCFASNFFLTYIKFRRMLIVSIIVSFPCLSHKMWALLIRLNLFFHSCVFGWGGYFMQNSDSTADQNHSIRKRNFYSSDSNKFRVNTLELTACYNITNKQYITIILYLSYYFDSKMMLIRILSNI